MQSQPREFESSVDIADPHPATDGHFVGNPLIPGVVILEHVRVALGKLDSELILRRFGRVKFTSPLKPGDKLIIRLSPKGESSFRFSCFNAGSASIASGEFSAERKYSMQ